MAAGPEQAKPHAEIDDQMGSWRQGDCVLQGWFAHRFAPDRPITSESEEAAGDGSDLVDTEVAGLVVLTQTCDVVRECAKRPFVTVAPLVEVSQQELAGVRASHRPNLAYLPALADRRLVADLDRAMTLEKPILALQQRVPGLTTENEQRRFAAAVARKFARFAFPDDFERWAYGLKRRIVEKHDRQSAEGTALRGLDEIRVTASPSWYGERVSIHLWFIRSPASATADQWDERLEQWLALIPAGGRFVDVSATVTELNDMTAADYVGSDQLDLDRLSVDG